jgi:hypothetical protein
LRHAFFFDVWLGFTPIACISQILGSSLTFPVVDVTSDSSFSRNVQAWCGEYARHYLDTATTEMKIGQMSQVMVRVASFHTQCLAQ